MSRFIIIVPSYNCEHYVEETLRSLLAQGDALKRCDSVILTDDCSQDRTIEVAKAVWTGPIPLVVFAAEKNRGEYKNMNECIARLPGHIEWYLVMHADNLAKARWLESLLDRAEIADDRVGTICTSWDDLAENGTIKRGEYRQPPTVERIVGNDASVLGTIQRGCWWHISSCVTRVATYREIGGLPLGLRLKGDWDFLLRLLKAGWDVEYIPTALMRYRMNPSGSSSISFRRHRDIYETLTVMQRHHTVASASQISAYHANMMPVLFRRLVRAVVAGTVERGARIVPAAGFVFVSWLKCMNEQWLGRRQFNWISSTDFSAQSRLEYLDTAMRRFHSQPERRRAYQGMLHSPESAQIEGELRKAVLREAPEAVLEVGCGSGRIYERLRSEGMRSRYTGVETADHIIAENRARFPEADWKVADGYALPVPPESQDCIFAYYVLERCVFPERFLEGVLAALKPNGRLLLTFPDMLASGFLGSQALGWDHRTVQAHLSDGRILHAIVRLWDTRVRLRAAMSRASRTVGPFPTNLSPRCLEPGCKIGPGVDAIYIATRREVEAWAKARNFRVSYPGGEKGQLRNNVLIEMVKSAFKEPSSVVTRTSSKAPQKRATTESNGPIGLLLFGVQILGADPGETLDAIDRT
jgi:glycosyltransferase involved in cell wall biosynthesis/SAM-dependent methyltransferase